MLTVGLTGGIGSGKSTVAALLSARGAVVIDADTVAREVVSPGAPAHAAIRARFGEGVFSPEDGTVDRAALARVVFEDSVARRDLNAIVHPAVGAAVDDLLDAERAKGGERIVVMEVPLLVESGWDKGDVVVVVDCPEDVAVRRLVEQRGMSEEDARRRVAAQATREERRARAGYVIDNSGSTDDLRKQVDALWAGLVNRQAQAELS